MAKIVFSNFFTFTVQTVGRNLPSLSCYERDKQAMLLRYLILPALFIIFQWDVLWSMENVKPHWTGKHCGECHLDDQPLENGASLKYNGNPVELCNRCHDGKTAPTEMHPFGVPLLDHMQQTVSSGWPLREGKITCLTCHNVIAQMSENPSEELVNPRFVRQPFSVSRNGFCFTCHQVNDFQQINPHRQHDESGMIVEETCLYCHQSIPNPEEDYGPNTIPLKNEQTKLCISCHGGNQTNHPTRGNHLVSIPLSMKQALDDLTTKQGVYLPLAGNTISCITCHNPHQKGVIKRETAKAGSGQSSFLRIKRGRDLCMTCHSSLKIPRRRSQREAVSSSKPEGIIEHKPYREEKCKACHAIDGFTEFKREKLFLCFQKGCHEPAMLENTSVHDPSVLGSCTFCHNPHSSGYEKLLFNTEDKLCFTCHPLLRDKKGSYFEVNHEQLLSFPTIRTIPPEYECSFCHNLNHKRDIFAVSTAVCSDCHIYLRGKFSQNPHQQSNPQGCSTCHDPHTSPVFSVRPVMVQVELFQVQKS